MEGPGTGAEGTHLRQENYSQLNRDKFLNACHNMIQLHLHKDDYNENLSYKF